MNMKRLFSIGLVFFFVLGLSGQTAHFIFIAPDDGAYDAAFAEGLQQRVRRLATAAGLSLEWHAYTRNVSADRLRRDLNTLPTAPDDVLWLYYYGPAAYDNDDLLEDFPYFELKEERVFLSRLHSLLRSRPHRLCLSFLDGANEETGIVGRHRADSPLDVRRLQALLGARGDLVVTGYGRYQLSNYHPRHGGLFTHAFWQALEYVAGPDCGYENIWAEVLYHADLFMEQMLGELQKEQKHYHHLNIPGHDFQDGPPPHGPQFSGDGGADYEYAIPRFPWPPPTATSRQALPREFLTDATRLRDVDETLSRAIRNCGYAEKSYYAVPGGFALVTRIEQFNPTDGRPLDGSRRWSTKVGGMEKFSIRSYLRALFFGEKGRFRIFVFLVTPAPFSMTGSEVSKADTEEWLSRGLDRLPGRLGEQAVTPEHHCTVLVYEFEQDESGEARFVNPSQFTAETHLRRANILNYLQIRP